MSAHIVNLFGVDNLVGDARVDEVCQTLSIVTRAWFDERGSFPDAVLVPATPQWIAAVAAASERPDGFIVREGSFTSIERASFTILNDVKIYFGGDDGAIDPFPITRRPHRSTP